jgi:anti-sigma factor (TIGR02949 family)
MSPPIPLDCRQIEALLPPFVDGVASSVEATAIQIHLDRCPPCRRAAEAQAAVRELLRCRCESLRGPAPNDLHARVRQGALVAGGRAPLLGVGGRLSALAAAAACVVAVGGTLVWATGRSSVLMAAQLTLDHLKCFLIDGDDHGTPLSAEAAEQRMQTQFGWSVPVPRVPVRDDVHLVAVRRCLYAEGIVAHVLYRYAGEPVSLFVMPHTVARTADLGAFGRHAQVLVRGDITYVLVAPAGLPDVPAAVGIGAQ